MFIRCAASVLLAAALLGPAAGCADKTDCKRLNERMTACAETLWDTLEPQMKGRLTDAFRVRRNAAHYQYCQRIKGTYKQSSKINKCLGIKDCAEFSDCFCRAVKKPSECGRAK
jgi:hypothetical protein